MREQDWQWLAEFIFNQLTPAEKSRVEKAAEQRMELINKLLEKDPNIPDTLTGEVALEYFLNQMLGVAS